MREIVDGVAVVGAGLAGTALAAALRERRVPVEVIDARPGPRSGDVDRGLCLWGEGITALDRIGLGQELRRNGTPVRRIQVWSGRGRLLLDVPIGAAGRPVGSAVRASRLFAMLRDRCGGVPFHAGHRLIGLSENEHGAQLSISGGWDLRAAVTVGADGAFSVVRRETLDDGPPQYAGDVVWEGVAAGASWPAAGTLHLFWWAQGLRGGAVALPDAGEVAWWVDEASGGPVPSQLEWPKRDLLARLDEVRGPLPDLIDGTHDQHVRRTPVVARRRARVPGRGPVTLIGDAAHPWPATLRMGGTAAVFDAVLLAEALARARSFEESLRRYERARQPRLAWTTRGLWRLRALETRWSWAGAAARDLAVRSLWADSTRALVGGLVGGDGELAAAGVRPVGARDQASGRETGG